MTSSDGTPIDFLGQPAPTLTSSAEIAVKTGSFTETPETNGLSHLYEHMLFKGTATRGVGEIARDIEAVGGSISSSQMFFYSRTHNGLRAI